MVVMEEADFIFIRPIVTKPNKQTCLLVKGYQHLILSYEMRGYAIIEKFNNRATAKINGFTSDSTEGEPLSKSN